MSHGGAVLFLARATADKVVPPGASSASATGAFVVDPAKRTVSYDLTFHGLEFGPPESIELRNFGMGGNGALILALCGGGGPSCPSLPSASLTGTWDGQGGATLDNQLLGEFASARVYLQIVGGDGKAEIRGQLEPNGAMVPVSNFVAHLEPAPGTQGRGTGTAVLSEVHFADERVAVFYEVTVAGTSGEPSSAVLVGVTDTTAAPMEFSAQNALPRLRRLPSRTAATGGTLTGEFETRRDQVEVPLATRMLAEGNREVGIAVSTEGFPEGELFGVFKPVS
jgi:hypothetical protein